MTRQQWMKDKPIQGKLYHFIDYKKKQPFFQQPIRIFIDDPVIKSYFMIKNLVYRDKQILVLKTEEDPSTIVLVEAIIEDGQLLYLSMLPEMIMKDLCSLLEELI
ncbi:hypothetical protein JK635_12045 [Neobacillus sp. YIM B02564]|uniref:Uncharacterized protein n=2 Tax=Bacillaceae TaxID=186817 RepID=A0ABS1TNN1_9BACI|nr:hypothetical protein [Neobacillus paridis]